MVVKDPVPFSYLPYVLKAPNMLGGKRDVENRAGGLVGNIL